MSHVVRSLAEVAKHFGRSYRTAQRWKKAGMPRRPGFGFDLDEIAGWLKTASYLGSTFRQMEADERVNVLFETAVLHLRRGLLHLCESFVKARGQGRTRLVDRAISNILRGVARQQSFLEGEGGEAP